MISCVLSTVHYRFSSCLLIFVKKILYRGQQFAQQIQQQNPELIEQLRNHVRSRSFSGSTEEHSWFKRHVFECCSTNSKRHTVACSKYHHCNSSQTWDGKSFVCIPYCLLKTDSLHTDLNISCMLYRCLCKWNINRVGDLLKSLCTREHFHSKRTRVTLLFVLCWREWILFIC